MIMSFDDIPEDREESFPCPVSGCGGNVTNGPDGWGCDKCGWVKTVNEKEKL